MSEAPLQFDMFWRPAVGTLVLRKPSENPACRYTAAELAIPLRVVRDAGDIEGHPMVWCTPTLPVRERIDRKGRKRVEVPTSQSPMLVEDLQPAHATTDISKSTGATS